MHTIGSVVRKKAIPERILQNAEPEFHYMLLEVLWSHGNILVINQFNKRIIIILEEVSPIRGRRIKVFFCACVSHLHFKTVKFFSLLILLGSAQGQP